MRFVIHCFFNQRHRRVHRVTFPFAQLCRNRGALRKNKQKTRRLNFKETIRTSLSQRGAKVSLKSQGCKKYQNSTGNLCFGCTDIWLYRRWGASFLFILRNIWTHKAQAQTDIWYMFTGRAYGRWGLYKSRRWAVRSVSKLLALARSQLVRPGSQLLCSRRSW